MWSGKAGSFGPGQSADVNEQGTCVNSIETLFLWAMLVWDPCPECWRVVLQECWVVKQVNQSTSYLTMKLTTWTPFLRVTSLVSLSSAAWSPPLIYSSTCVLD